MKSKEKSVPIKSPSDERLILEELNKRDAKYYLIAKTMIETDIPFSRLVEYKACDLYNKKELTYSSKHGITRTMPLSDELYNDYRIYLKNVPKNRLAFIGGLSGEKIHPATMQVVFNSVRKSCNLPYILNNTTLHMTFLYHILKADGNCIRLRQYMHAPSVKYVYDYLSLSMPDNYEDALIGHDEKEKLLKYSHIFEETIADTKSIIENIKENLLYPENITREDASRYVAFQRALSEANYNFKESS